MLNKHVIKQKELYHLTDLIPNGKTILYGQSGVGKTYSILKHFNRNKIKPILLDFDNNPKYDFDYHHLDGVKVMQEFFSRYHRGKIDNECDLMDENLPLIIDTYAMMDKCLNSIPLKEDTNRSELMTNIEMLDIFIERFMYCPDDAIIFIAHTKNSRTDTHPDMDDIFANNCDCKLRLVHDISKKIDDVYLIKEKSRLSGGDNVIWDWER